jgi:hypothetical protein
MEQRDDSTSNWDFDFDFGTGSTTDAADTTDDAPVDDRPLRKGGGPPGRSAFLPGGRLRRLSRDRGTTRIPEREPAPTAFTPASGGSPEAAPEPAFRPITDWAAGPSAPGFESFESFEFEPFAGDAPADPVVDPEAPRTAGNRSFPGGRAKLPRLNPDADAETEVAYVSTAFIPGGQAETDDDRRSGFHGYNTYESLFADATIADPLTKPVDDDAYAVLGVNPDDDWKVVVRAHRQLVKANHPDRLGDAPTAVRQEAEERLRQINLAYREVKEHRREEGSLPTAGDGEDNDD